MRHASGAGPPGVSGTTTPAESPLQRGGARRGAAANSVVCRAAHWLVLILPILVRASVDALRAHGPVAALERSEPGGRVRSRQVPPPAPRVKRVDDRVPLAVGKPSDAGVLRERVPRSDEHDQAEGEEHAVQRLQPRVAERELLLRRLRLEVVCLPRRTTDTDRGGSVNMNLLKPTHLSV